MNDAMMRSPQTHTNVSADSVPMAGLARGITMLISVRMVDAPRNTLVYLTYSDRLIEGSPQNSVTAVPVDRANKIPLK